MNRVQPENVHSTIFTPQEYQVELIDSCLRENTVAVLAPRSTRSFLITMVTRELSYLTRSRSGDECHNQKTLIIGKSGYKLVYAGESIQQNTNLAVATYTETEQVQGWLAEKWMKIFTESQVVVMTVEVLGEAMEKGDLPFDFLNLFVIMDAHQFLSSDTLTQVLSHISSSCRILAMTTPILRKSFTPPMLEGFLSYVKQATSCSINTASEIVTILRYIHKPHEKFILCSNPSLRPQSSTEEEVRRLTANALNFLDDHRYDLVEVYGPEYEEFCIGVPDPKKEPYQILNDFVYILNTLGLWCADRAALYALVEIEKLKKKTAYDRHYLLLCLIFSVMARIRAVIEESFDDLSELEQIENYSTPKILRFLEILRTIRPLNFIDPRKRRDKGEAHTDGCDEDKTELTLEFCCDCKAKQISNCPPKLENKMNKKSSNSNFSNLSTSADGDDSCEEGSIQKLDEINSEQYNPKVIVSDEYLPTHGSFAESPKEAVNNVSSENCDLLLNNSGDKAIVNLSPTKNMGIVNGYINDDSLSDRENSSSCSSPSLHDAVSKSLHSSLPSNRETDNTSPTTTFASCESVTALNFDEPDLTFSTGKNLCNSICYCQCHKEDLSLLRQGNSPFDKHTDDPDAKTDDEMQTSAAADSVGDVLSPSLITEGVDVCQNEDQLGGVCSLNSENATKASSEEKDAPACEPEGLSNDINGEDMTTPINAAVNETALTNPSGKIGTMADTLAQLLPTINKFKRRREDIREKIKVHNPDDPDSVCALIFVRSRNTAKIVYRLLKELSDIGGDFGWIFPQYTVELSKNLAEDTRAAEAEHKKQKEVLRRFRHHECNVLVSTAVLEAGIDIPHCNFVFRFDPAANFASYIHSRGRAKGLETFYFHLVTKDEEYNFLRDIASFTAFEKVLVNDCMLVERGTDHEVTAEEANYSFPSYSTKSGALVTMDTSIALLNKYCAKLPSDTFTRLTPSWDVESKVVDVAGAYQCTIMLPINSPLKGYTKSPWMPKLSLAKMAAATMVCQRLHEIGELDDNLQPVGKESMQMEEYCAPLLEDQVSEGMARPGTTKRRQYYNKKITNCLIGEQPVAKISLWVYELDMVLSCPIPDDQNTRGRKIYRPELSVRSLGLITTKPIPQVGGFPVFTRSGEVLVHLRDTESKSHISQTQLEKIQNFHKFTFTHVLRLEKYPIKFDPLISSTAFYITPLITDNGTKIIDWNFLDLIVSRGDPRPIPPTDEDRKESTFNESLYEDAVVMPWYRNQDQPQYFYVAEICSHLTPQSDFPDAGFETFEKYYLTKYGLQVCNLRQPLLDVDHTSGRLNLLTPRHVNRKGVALPTTSDETKKAKRENLQQKQILVPELCTIHPFPASLWRKAVCLPTILYRINGLLLANELRLFVASGIGLGTTLLDTDFEWPNHNFGWSLADVLQRNKEAKRGEAGKQKKKSLVASSKEVSLEVEDEKKPSDGKKRDSELEIGTWSNDMAIESDEIGDTDSIADEFEIEAFDPTIDLPDNLTILDGACQIDNDTEGELGADWGTGLPERKTKKPSKGKMFNGEVRVGSPSNFEVDGWDGFGPSGGLYNPYNGAGCNSFEMYDSFHDYDDYEGFDSEPELDEEDGKVTPPGEWEEEVKRPPFLVTEDCSSDEELEWPVEEKEQSAKEVEYESFIERRVGEIPKELSYLQEDEALIVKKTLRDKLLQAKTDEDDIENTAMGSDLQDCEAGISPNSKTEANNLDKESSPCAVSSITKEEPAKCVSIVDGKSNSLKINSTFTDFTTNIDRKATLEHVSEAAAILELSSGCPVKDKDAFSFDRQPDLTIHPGPSPGVILQALTMSNANDGVNLERLETIGDSYLKYAITAYLYCVYPQRHEGKLSYLRSKQVSNLNLYRLGKRKGLGERMVATKFEPHDNWLPPGYFVPHELEEALIDSGVPAGHWNMADFPGLHELAREDIRRLVQDKSEQIKLNNAEQLAGELITVPNPQDLPIFIPYNLLTQHSIPDKSIADSVEALIGAYLTSCGPRGALLFMSWLGIKVLPQSVAESPDGKVVTYKQLSAPPSPLSHCPLEDAKSQLKLLLSGYDQFEDKIGYKFVDQSYLLQAFTHASYYKNRITDCYQRLEFLGDAVLDYLITRHLFEDERQHSPGALTDLRSALVNNTIFASLAVKYEFHKYFRHFSPGLDRIVRDFVRMQEENGNKVNEEYYFIEEEEGETAEDIEVPKALGDVFESVAGAIFLDSGGSLDAVWKVYYFMMNSEIEQFSRVVPKSPIRELLEMEPETAKFGKPERLVDGKVRVSVDIFGKGSFSGVGRNYRIAKSTAAKRALRHLKKLQLMAISEVDICS